MPSQPPTSQKNTRHARNGSRTSTLKMEPPSGPPAKKMRPLTALSKPPVFDLGSSQASASQRSQPSQSRSASQARSQSSKGKQRAEPDVIQVMDSDEEMNENEESEGRLWVDMYEPKSEADLAVHVKKVGAVRQWLVDAFDSPSERIRKYRRILALTGPAGTAKTATLRVLASELGFDILEWRNSTDDVFTPASDLDPYSDRSDYESLTEKFHKFLLRASNCRPLFDSGASGSKNTRQVVLLEDLPNVLHQPTQRAFHESLQAIIAGASTHVVPVVIVVSDAGVRGEGGDDASANVGRASARETVDFRTVVPKALWNSPYVTQISFNPIAPTLMKRALQSLLKLHFSKPSSKTHVVQPSKDMLDLIVESSNGDIRSAIMALQFACTNPSADGLSSTKGKAKSKRRGGDTRALLEAVTRREQSLALFHLIGKILYNKRKGDPPPPSMSKSDAQQERDLDATLKDPPKLPAHLQDHDRRASRVDVDTLYADTPIDSSLLALYIHQNYTQYCDDLAQADGVIDALSYVDASGGDSWLQANPHRFHLVTLGTLHALPSPVPRRGQRSYKPEFFDVLRKERGAADAARDALEWARQRDGLGAGWTARDVVLELGGVLKALDAKGSAYRDTAARPPASHRAFSRLQFTYASTSAAQLADENDVVPYDVGEVEEDGGEADGEEEVPEPEKAAWGGWLEEDDIEEA